MQSNDLRQDIEPQVIIAAGRPQTPECVMSSPLQAFRCRPDLLARLDAFGRRKGMSARGAIIVYFLSSALDATERPAPLALSPAAGGIDDWDMA